ncbi:MAG: PorT family protein [Bacteroidetes bacterium]|nr:PorT family protein [Bacteroidota bacterium]
MIKKRKFLRLSRLIIIASVCLATVIPFDTFAQRQRVENMPTYDFSKYHFGFILAVNQMLFTIRPVENLNLIYFDSIAAAEINADSAKIFSIESEPTYGFTVGIVSNLRLGNYFDLRFVPSLAFGERNLDYRFKKYPDTTNLVLDVRKNIPSTFVEFPFTLKYKSKRLNNYRAYLLGGFSYRFDLSSQAKKKKETGVVQVKLNRNDVYLNLGFGFDFYFEWFKFGTELTMSYGLFDILKHENNIYTEGIDKLSSKVFQLTFTFE